MITLGTLSKVRLSTLANCLGRLDWRRQKDGRHRFTLNLTRYWRFDRRFATLRGTFHTWIDRRVGQLIAIYPDDFFPPLTPLNDFSASSEWGNVWKSSEMRSTALLVQTLVLITAVSRAVDLPVCYFSLFAMIRLSKLRDHMNPILIINPTCVWMRDSWTG